MNGVRPRCKCCGQLLTSEAIAELTGEKWLDWLNKKVGTTNWVLAARLTARLKRDYGYDLAIPRKKYDALFIEYIRQGWEKASAHAEGKVTK